MCGIAGEFGAAPTWQVDRPRVRAMADAVAHRGPDGDGLRAGPGFALAHRRLAIVDLEGGAQPMDDGSGEIWVTFNGEIYNFRELRAELEREGCAFRTDCDTEVLAHGYRIWGERLPERLNGMFAFAIADQRDHSLFMARDRLGKKPLFYSDRGECLWFGSELKAMLARDDMRRAIHEPAVAKFLCLRYVPDPATIFEGVQQLPPGHRLWYRNGRVDVQRYWSLSFANPRPRQFRDVQEELLALLDDAVQIRLMGDVPLGAFLSGGVDSAAVVDSMTRVSGSTVVACSIGFEDRRFDERPYAREVAEARGVRLHEAVIQAADLLQQDWFATTFDQPFADSSAIPTYHVSRLARQFVTVALSGDGGDESFAGYRRYPFDHLENRIRRALPAGIWGLLGACYPKADFLPRGLRFKRTLQNLARDPALVYARSVSASLPEEVAPLLQPRYAAAAPTALGDVIDAYHAADGPDALSRAAATDFATYLPGDILTKVDRASMAVSLEVRAPLLDYRIVELAASLPSALKLEGHQTKGLLRRALRDRLGESVVDRRKQGFSVPLRDWVAGDVGAELERALRGDRLAAVVDGRRVGELLRQHRSGRADHGELLWAVVVLDRFLARWL